MIRETKPTRSAFVILLMTGGLLTGCQQVTAPQESLRIVAGSENKSLEPLVQRFARENQVTIQLEYKGSVEIMRQLESGGGDADAVWPAQSLWTSLGDTQRRVKDAQSIYWSPVGLAVKESVAQRLGWNDKKTVSTEEIRKAAQAGRLRFLMTSATQSNSGAAAYLAFLSAFAGKPQVLSETDLQKPTVQKNVASLLGGVNRSSGSSGWLTELFVSRYDDYDAMFNYEVMATEASAKLAAQGRERLTVIYPSDGVAIADAPLGYVEHGQPASKRQAFDKLQRWLLSPQIQQELAATGRRTGPIGDAFPSQLRLPRAEVVRQALDLYQTTLRKPSLTVYCLDVSGSMRGERLEQLKSAMRGLLNQDLARRSLLQASPRDITVVIPFSGAPQALWEVRGNAPDALASLNAKIQALEATGGTDIYSPTIQALRWIHQQPGYEDYFPAVILLTDGESNTGASLSEVQQQKLDIPVFAIRFGEASPGQLDALTGATSGKTFEGRGNLSAAFREAKGYNG
ncbi:VWA domain-containing protein [Armatimonas rosea]|uniref:Ca-activated chloride channel family protein n=1 Tax=Armatimonas rosea TaxID=685828 RepID=A0A7W9SR69_ARMRO|nr:VWA domain-containing protein [Armatimonas rosea]MBB6050950.1 Ca-activated chloride channel family protein [Armatimonas rosea]